MAVSPDSSQHSRAPAALLIVVSILLTQGCASSGLRTARANYYMGNYVSAEANLAKLPEGNTSRVLHLMERGMVRQARQDYSASIKDWLEAIDTSRKLDIISVTRDTSSMIINDKIQYFIGAPYERTLLHSFNALNYFALRQWDDTAVEARNIIGLQKNLNGYPDDAFSRYLSGVCFEMVDDNESAAFQYRQTSKALRNFQIQDRSGQIIASSNTPPGLAMPAPKKPGDSELICFILIGRAPRETDSCNYISAVPSEPYAEIFAGDTRLGRSYVFADTHELMRATEKREAALKALKTASRIVLKDAVADAVGGKHEKSSSLERELIGEILRLVLFSLEQPDTRRWETLPRWLEIARVPCPPDLSEIRVEFISNTGPVSRKIISQSLVKNGRKFVAFVRYM